MTEIDYMNIWNCQRKKILQGKWLDELSKVNLQGSQKTANQAALNYRKEFRRQRRQERTGDRGQQCSQILNLDLQEPLGNFANSLLAALNSKFLHSLKPLGKFLWKLMTKSRADQHGIGSTVIVASVT